ncbi:hypothetical protein QE152_g39337 [Popillia japonica]|uniref:Uncharacterized protein n=1 Tax=Popillia japonica TaxID=7064 RepID=A0AAW1HU05_POPJA
MDYSAGLQEFKREKMELTELKLIYPNLYNFDLTLSENLKNRTNEKKKDLQERFRNLSITCVDHNKWLFYNI